MGTMTSLKDATWDAHLRMEKRLAIKDRFSTLASYSGHIAQLLAFYEPAESAWAGFLEPVLDDYPTRRKAPLLAADLRAVGGIAIANAILPMVADSASALGAFYVLEGATLGGQHLLPVVERTLGLSAAHGASYLASYGSRVGQMWQAFGNAVETHCQTPETAGRAIAAAGSTFLAMEAWLCGVQI